MRLPVSESRSEAIRIRLSEEAWAYFEGLRVKAQELDPDAVQDGDTGTRQVLAVWIEGMIREAIDGAV